VQQRKVKGTIHWVSAEDCRKAEVRLFDRLFTEYDPDNAEEGKTFLDYINPDSLKTVEAIIEPKLISEEIMQSYQFERLGYFSIDKDSTDEKLVFNRTVSLRDSWKRINK
jgi:glutaminyl-tRNA synthetase